MFSAINQTFFSTYNRPVKFGGSCSNLEIFTEKDLGADKSKISNAVLKNDVFERRFSTPEGEEITSKDLVERIANNSTKTLPGTSQPRHFLILAEGGGGVGKTTLLRRILALLEEKRVETFFIAQNKKKDFHDKQKKFETTKSPTVIGWDEYQLADLGGGKLPFAPFSTPIPEKIQRNKNISFVATVSTGVEDDFLDADEKQTLRSLFPEENRLTLEKPKPEELLKIFDYMLNYAGFKVIPDEYFTARPKENARLTSEQGYQWGAGQAFSNQQRQDLLSTVFADNSRFVENPNFTKVLRHLRDTLEDNKIGNSRFVEVIPFGVIVSSFEDGRAWAKWIEIQRTRTSKSRHKEQKAA